MIRRFALAAMAVLALALGACTTHTGSVHAAASSAAASFKANPATVHAEQAAARKLALCGAKHGLNTTATLTPPPVRFTKVSVSPSLVNAVHPIRTAQNLYNALVASVRCTAPPGTYASVKACMQVGMQHVLMVGSSLAKLLNLAVTCIVGAPQ